MQEHKDDFIPFTEFGIGEFALYLAEMKKPASWAGHLELVALARIFG
jgi:hypothetical protein